MIVQREEEREGSDDMNGKKSEANIDTKTDSVCFHSRCVSSKLSKRIQSLLIKSRHNHYLPYIDRVNDREGKTVDSLVEKQFYPCISGSI